MSVHSCSFGELDVQVYDPAKCLECTPTPRLTVSLVVTQRRTVITCHFDPMRKYLFVMGKSAALKSN